MQQINSTGAPGFLPAQIGNAPITMSSREIAELVNSRHDDVKRSIARLAERGVIQLPPTAEVKNHLGQTVSEFLIGKRDSYVIVAQLSPEFTARLVDRWQELEAGQFQMPTTAQAFANVFQMVADSERRQVEQARELKAIGAKVEQIAQAQLLKSKPQNAETISEIRKRINRQYGLSKDIVDTVVARLTYSPKPAGMVRNDHERAEGSSYAVYWIRDVSQAFKFFVAECQMATATQATHPHIKGRFKLTAAA